MFFLQFFGVHSVAEVVSRGMVVLDGLDIWSIRVEMIGYRLVEM